MEESMDPEIEGIGHYILHSENGFRYMRIECPICKVWIDGPILIREGRVHLFETWPVDTHRILEIAAGWQKRLQGKAEIPIEKVHIHVQVVNLSIYPDWEKLGLAQYFRLGKLIAEPKDIVEGRYDAVLIHLFADSDMTPEELEELVCHEIVHVAFPNDGGNRKTPLTASLAEFFSDSASEEWVEKKTKELLHEYGYVFRERI